MQLPCASAFAFVLDVSQCLWPRASSDEARGSDTFHTTRASPPPAAPVDEGLYALSWLSGASGVHSHARQIAFSILFNRTAPSLTRECSHIAAVYSVMTSMYLHAATPILRSDSLSKASGLAVTLKLDNLQPSGSFKIRGVGYMCCKVRSFLFSF